MPSRPQQVRPTDPLVRWIVSDEDPPALLHDGGNVAWLGRASRPGEKWVTGLGDEPVRVVDLVERMAAEHEVHGVTVPEPAFALLPDRLRSPDPGHWCLWQLSPEGADPRPGDGAIDLQLDDPRIAPLLGHSTSAHVFPGDPRLVRWAGVLDGDRLVAVAGQITERSGAAHLLSVCTDPDYRGRGLAGEVCQRIIAAVVAEGAPMIVLEMYASNEAGRRAYTRLGFQEVGHYASGLLAGALDADRA